MAAANNRATAWTFVLDEPTRILVVDDDPILREFASVYLASPSTPIDTACDGVAARAQLARASYDIIVLDIEMPRLDGLSLLQEIRSDEMLRHLPVIMLTAHDDIASIDRAYHLGANSFASKPVNWRQLSYQIRYVLRSSRLERLQWDLRKCEKDSDVVTSSEGDVRDFLQTVIQQVDSIEEKRSVLDRAQRLEALGNIRSIAIQTLAEYSEQTPMTLVDGVRRTRALS